MASESKTPRMSDHPNMTAFKASNQTKKEFFLGTTILGMHEVIEQHRGSPPPTISHWRQSDKVDYRTIKANLPVKDAVEFIETYAMNLTRTSAWKVLRQRA